MLSVRMGGTFEAESWGSCGCPEWKPLEAEYKTEGSLADFDVLWVEWSKPQLVQLEQRHGLEKTAAVGRGTHSVCGWRPFFLFLWFLLFLLLSSWNSLYNSVSPIENHSCSLGYVVKQFTNSYLIIYCRPFNQVTVVQRWYWSVSWIRLGANSHKSSVLVHLLDLTY